MRRRLLGVPRALFSASPRCLAAARRGLPAVRWTRSTPLWAGAGAATAALAWRGLVHADDGSAQTRSVGEWLRLRLPGGQDVGPAIARTRRLVHRAAGRDNPHDELRRLRELLVEGRDGLHIIGLGHHHPWRANAHLVPTAIDAGLLAVIDRVLSSPESSSHETRAYAAALLGPLTAHPRAHDHLRPSSLRGCAREATRLLALYQQCEGVVPSALGHFAPSDLPNLHAALSALLHTACASRAGLVQRGDTRAFCQRELPGLAARLLAESEFALSAHGKLAARARADGDEELARAAASVAHAARTAQRLALHTLSDLAHGASRASHALPDVAPALLLAAAAPEGGVAAQARAALRQYATEYAAAGMPGLYQPPPEHEEETPQQEQEDAAPAATEGLIPASWLRAVGWLPNAQLGAVQGASEQASLARQVVREGLSAATGPEPAPQPLAAGPRAATVAALMVARTATWQDSLWAWLARSPRSSAAFAADAGSVARGATEVGVASTVGAAGYATMLLLAGDTRSLTARKAAVAGAGGGLLVAVHYAMLWAQARATHADADSIALHHRLWVGTQGVVAALLVARVRRPLRGVGRLSGAVLALMATDLLCPDSADVER